MKSLSPGLCLIRLNEKYGRDDINNISKEVEGKIPSEVIQYSKVFWERHQELTDGDRYVKEVIKYKVCMNIGQTVQGIFHKSTKVQ